jgi:hypothetical protein
MDPYVSEALASAWIGERRSTPSASTRPAGCSGGEAQR